LFPKIKKNGQIFQTNITCFYFWQIVTEWSLDEKNLPSPVESLLKTVGQVLVIKSIYRTRSQGKGSGCPRKLKKRRVKNRGTNLIKIARFMVGIFPSHGAF